MGGSGSGSAASAEPAAFAPGAESRACSCDPAAGATPPVWNNAWQRARPLLSHRINSLESWELQPEQGAAGRALSPGTALPATPTGSLWAAPGPGPLGIARSAAGGGQVQIADGSH